MNSKLLTEEVQAFLHENQSTDFRKVSLMKSPFPDVSSAELAQQIKGRQIAKQKFPFFLENPNVVYPPSLNLEQASSWPTALYKSKILKAKTLIDLTAGMGIDAYGFAQEFEEVTALERNPELVEISKHNYQVLNQMNLHYVNCEFEEYFQENLNQKWDVIYLDPARRKDSQKKFILEDLEPNVLEWKDEFFKRADWVMIKLSPLLDLKLVTEQIPEVKEIHLVAVKNEVKELLLICQKELANNPKIIAVNLESDQLDFEYQLEEENAAIANFSEPKKYLYEPNVAVMKSGAFKLISDRFQVYKLEKNTHLYTSNDLLESFPGKVFEVIQEVKNPKKEIKNGSYHVVSKNYPLSVELIRKKYNLKESETESLFFIESTIGKQILHCRRIR
ncbi:class I SAM-dependent methyltransferase [Moheibacter stercoris]|uniref:16S rRNA G966 N2-methylase RsmD n=1 Tax=Moheibacter stercoris TaxID=1628251 RepID=A0ABV2LWC8_9FLAO